MVPQIWSAGQNVLSFWTIVCPLNSLKTQKIKTLKKWKKNPGDIIILHNCTKNYDQMMHRSWDMVHDSPKNQILEKWSITLQISSFYICVPKIMIRWCMLPETWCVTDVIIFQLGPFLSFYPCNIPKNQNFEKMKQTPGDIIILHICTKNYDQMTYASWDMVCDRCNCYFSFWAIFCPFTP